MTPREALYQLLHTLGYDEHDVRTVDIEPGIIRVEHFILDEHGKKQWASDGYEALTDITEHHIA